MLLKLNFEPLKSIVLLPLADNCQILQEVESLEARLSAASDAQAMTAGQHPMKSPLESPFGSPIGSVNTALPISPSVQVCTPTDTLPAVLASIPWYVSSGAAR